MREINPVLNRGRKAGILPVQSERFYNLITKSRAKSDGLGANSIGRMAEGDTSHAIGEIPGVDPGRF